MWGTGALVVNILVAQHGFTPENISFWRFLIGAVVLVGIFGRRIIWSQLRPILITILIAGTAMSGYVLLWFLGIEQMGAAIPTLIALCLPPVIVTIISVFRGQEVGFTTNSCSFGSNHRYSFNHHSTRYYCFSR